MIIKVCGMRQPDNINQLLTLPIDYMGMIFYEKSPRFVSNLSLSQIPLHSHIKRVGVFVNADEAYIKQKIADYRLDLVQLHGKESPAFCERINSILPVIKAFSISDAADFDQTKAYEGLCRYLLFDAKTSQYGGSGQKFDWRILDAYTGQIPFLLSGGISFADAMAIKGIVHPLFEGIDLNSRFEIEPGLKDILKLKQFIKNIQS